jgi:hypothetical protein
MGASLVLAQIQAEQRVLHDLAERQVDPVLPPGNLERRLPELHPLDEWLDQVGLRVAHQVRPEHLSAGRVCDHLQMPVASFIAQPYAVSPDSRDLVT